LQELFEIHAEFTKLEKIEFTGIKGKQLSSQTMQIFDDFNEVYKKFTFVTYDPLNTEDDVSVTDINIIAINCCGVFVLNVFCVNLYCNTLLFIVHAS